MVLGEPLIFVFFCLFCLFWVLPVDLALFALGLEPPLRWVYKAVFGFSFLFQCLFPGSWGILLLVAGVGV